MTSIVIVGDITKIIWKIPLEELRPYDKFRVNEIQVDTELLYKAIIQLKTNEIKEEAYPGAMSKNILL